MRGNKLTNVLLTAALAASVLGLAPTTTAHAQEIQITGPLAGAPAVRRMRQYRTGRVQLIVPTAGFTLQDEFARHLMVGLEANVHFTDFLGIGVWGAMANFANAFQINSDLTSQIIANGQTTARNQLAMPSNEGFGDQVARLVGLASVHAIFAPLRGKLALFQGAFVDTDFYILAGFAAAFVEERADFTMANGSENCVNATNDAERTAACVPSQSARNTRFAPAPMLGIGLNLYFNDFLGLALQWRAFPFNMNPAGDDFAGATATSSVSQPDGEISAADQRFYFHHMMNIGLIINLPPDAAVSE